MPETNHNEPYGSLHCYPSINIPARWLANEIREAEHCAEEATKKNMFFTAGQYIGRAEAFQELLDEFNSPSGTSECDHPRHTNPGLITPRPLCGLDR